MVIHVNPAINNFIQIRGFEVSKEVFHNNIPIVAEPQMNIDNCISI